MCSLCSTSWGRRNNWAFSIKRNIAQAAISTPTGKINVVFSQNKGNSNLWGRGAAREYYCSQSLKRTRGRLVDVYSLIHFADMPQYGERWKQSMNCVFFMSRFNSFGMLRCVVRKIFPDVSSGRTPSSWSIRPGRVFFDPEYESTTVFRNFGNYLPRKMTSHTRRLWSSEIPLW